MALAALITTSDLTARGVDTSNATLVTSLIATVSEAIREAAGSAITTVTSELTMLPGRGKWLDVPGPVQSVDSITLDGDTITDYEIISGRIWRELEWLTAGENALIVITYTHGLTAVPDDVKDLACSMVAGGVAAAADGYDMNRTIAYERVDDYQRGYRQGDDAPGSPMEISQRTREWLRGKFGTTATVIGVY